MKIECPECEGGGRVPLGEHFVSREMASDAGEPSMEGMSMGIEWGPCRECGGSGAIEKEVGWPFPAPVVDPKPKPADEFEAARAKYARARANLDRLGRRLK